MSDENADIVRFGRMTALCKPKAGVRGTVSGASLRCQDDLTVC